MEKRLLIAIVLMTAAIMFTNFLFPPPTPEEAAESAVEQADSVDTPAPVAQVELPLPTAAATAIEDTVFVESGLYRYAFSTRGARLIRAEMLDYSSYVEEGMPVQIVPTSAGHFIDYELVVDGQEIPFSDLVFEPSTDRLEVGAASDLRFAYADSSGFGVTIDYTFDPDHYLVGAEGRVTGIGDRPASLQIDMGPRLEVHEARDHQSEREFAVVSRWPERFNRLPFRSVDGTETLDPNATWVGLKDKYFLAAVIAPEERPLSSTSVTRLEGDVREIDGDEVEMPQVELTTDLPIANGAFEFDLYLGPQEFNRLAGVGFDLEEVTPYGYRWIQPIIRPFAAAVLWVLNTLHESLGVGYGWVLILFGVMMRVVLWPLNAKAMRAQMKNMAVQPLLQELRDKHKNDPQKQQEAMLALYKEHGFNPLAGCLPMLVPFPVLITLFFVFQNTIAFRGAEFLWLPDLSLRDPFYILPVVLVISMFSLQWISAHLSGMEQNPQMKMMMYFMPLMMGALFFMFPSGLNLYYATQQIASMPQQVLIAKERRRAQETIKKNGGPKLPPPKGGRSRSKAKR